MDEHGFTIKALDLSTWDAFVALVEANGGIFGGCWCQFGSPAEVPRIKNRKEYDKQLDEPPDWRIACC